MTNDPKQGDGNDKPPRTIPDTRETRRIEKGDWGTDKEDKAK